MQGGLHRFREVLITLLAQTHVKLYWTCLWMLQQYGLPEFAPIKVLVCEYMVTRRGTGRHSHIAGKSTHNQRIERLWRDVFRCVLSTFHSLFYFMEELGSLDPASDFDLFVLHAVFLPKVGHCLNEFMHSWNCYPLRTEHNWSPRKIWLNGMVDPTGTDLCSWCLWPTSRWCGILWCRPLPLNEDLDSLEIPETHSPLNREHTHQLQKFIKSAVDFDYGYSTFNMPINMQSNYWKRNSNLSRFVMHVVCFLLIYCYWYPFLSVVGLDYSYSPCIQDHFLFPYGLG